MGSYVGASHVLFLILIRSPANRKVFQTLGIGDCHKIECVSATTIIALNYYSCNTEQLLLTHRGFRTVVSSLFSGHGRTTRLELGMLSRVMWRTFLRTHQSLCDSRKMRCVEPILSSSVISTRWRPFHSPNNCLSEHVTCQISRAWGFALAGVT